MIVVEPLVLPHMWIYCILGKKLEVCVCTFGSKINAPPLVLGGWSPDVQYFKHSTRVFTVKKDRRNTCINLFLKEGEKCQAISEMSFPFFTVFPDPLGPTINVSGRPNTIVAGFSGEKDLIPLF